MELEKTLKEVLEISPVTPHIFLESMLTVERGARPASLVFMDQFNQKKMGRPTSLNTEEHQWYRDVKKAAEQMGLKTFIMTDVDGPPGSAVFPKVVFYKEDHIGDKFRSLEETYKEINQIKTKENKLDARFFPAKYDEGLLFGIPSCCASNFIETRIQSFSGGGKDSTIEEVLRKKLVNLADDVNEVGKLPVNFLSMFWAYEVYPCSLDCKPAQMKGYEVLSCFGDQKVAELYKDVIMVNNAKALHTRWAVIEMPKRIPHTEDIYRKFNQGVLDYIQENF